LKINKKKPTLLLSGENLELRRVGEKRRGLSSIIEDFK